MCRARGIWWGAHRHVEKGLGGTLGMDRRQHQLRGASSAGPQNLAPVLGPEGSELAGQHGIRMGQEQPGGRWQGEWTQVAADEEGFQGQV